MLASTLLSIEVDQLSFPNKQDAVTFFLDFSSDLLLFSAPQQDLQATIDQRLFDNIIIFLHLLVFEIRLI